MICVNNKNKTNDNCILIIYLQNNTKPYDTRIKNQELFIIQR